MDFQKPKIFALFTLDVTTLHFGVVTLNFSCLYNVTTLNANVKTLHFGCPYNVAALNFNVVTLH